MERQNRDKKSCYEKVKIFSEKCGNNETNDPYKQRAYTDVFKIAFLYKFGGKTKV